MLIVNQNAINTLCVTASEFLQDTTTGGTNTGFTLKLINETTLITYSGITLTDTSNYTDRYNIFTLTLTGKTFESYSSSTIYLPNNGFYTYYIYYNHSGISEIAEQGFFKVDGVNQITTYEYPKKNTYVSYKKQT